MNKTKLFELVFGEEFCDQIQEIGESYSKNCWDMGDLTIQAVDNLQTIKSAIMRGDSNPHFADYIFGFGQMDVYKQMELRFGPKVRTIRDYVSISKFYEQPIRERYHYLPYSHFRFAKSCGSEIAVRVLELSSKAMDSNGGRPPSVSWLEVNLWRITGDPERTLDEMDNIQEFDNVVSSVSASDLSEPADEPIPAVMHYFIHRVKRLMDNLRNRLEQAQMSDERRDRINDLIDNISELADELQGESVHDTI